METLERLRHRIDTANEMQSVVRTMKGLAAVNIRAFETASHAVEHYQQTVELGMQILFARRPELVSREMATKKPGGTTGVMVFGSEQGLCGSFNRLAFVQAEKSTNELEAPRVAAAGLRMVDFFHAKIGESVERLSMPASVDGIADCVTDAIVLAMRWLETGNVSRVLLVHNRLVTTATYTPQVITLFPFDEDWLRDLRTRPWESRCLPTFFGSPDSLLRRLIRHHLFIGLYRAFAESLAAEHAARLAAMQAAEKNIDERLAQLELNFHQQRQATITEELLDVVSGFEALRNEH